MYDRRSKVVHVGEEAERWKKISSKLMSEESSDDELGTIIVHRPVWSSKSRHRFYNFCLGTGVPRLCAGFGTSSSASLAYS